MVDLAGFGHRKITEISGGQQQRVALARALAPDPRILMLDEPLSNLDPALRERTRRALGEILRKSGTTTILVTHEQEEAFELGDRVGVLHDGRLAQVASAEEIYETPATAFVASFIGQVTFCAASSRNVATRPAQRCIACGCWASGGLPTGPQTSGQGAATTSGYGGFGRGGRQAGSAAFVDRQGGR